MFLDSFHLNLLCKDTYPGLFVPLTFEKNLRNSHPNSQTKVSTGLAQQTRPPSPNTHLKVIPKFHSKRHCRKRPKSLWLLTTFTNSKRTLTASISLMPPSYMLTKFICISGHFIKPVGEMESYIKLIFYNYSTSHVYSSSSRVWAAILSKSL